MPRIDFEPQSFEQHVNLLTIGDLVDLGFYRAKPYYILQVFPPKVSVHSINFCMSVRFAKAGLVAVMFVVYFKSGRGCIWATWPGK